MRTNRLPHLIIVLLIGAALLAACMPADAATIQDPTVSPTAPVQPAGSQQIQVTEADQGKDFQLNTGDVLIIVLEANPSTGYSWQVKPADNPVVEQAGEPAFKADSDLLGAPGKITLTLNAVRAGSQELTLLYQRSFEKDVQPAKTFTINVSVPGSGPSSTVQPTSGPNQPQKIPVTAADMGKDFQLNVGDQLTIVLEGNPSTGYTWEVSPVDNPVVALTDDPVFKAESDLLGAPGALTLTLVATQPGYQSLILVYHQPFDKNTPPEKVFFINVAVKDASTPNMAQPTAAPSMQDTPTTFVNPPNGWKGWQVYTNTEYGFSFQYPPGWRLVEVTGEDKTLSGHAVQLIPDTQPDAMMQVAFKRASDDMRLGRTGLGSGELISFGKVLFMGNELTRRVLVLEGKHMTVLYTGGDAVQAGDLVFNFSLDYLGTDRAGLAEDVEVGSDAIVASVTLTN